MTDPNSTGPQPEPAQAGQGGAPQHPVYAPPAYGPPAYAPPVFARDPRPAAPAPPSAPAAAPAPAPGATPGAASIPPGPGEPFDGASSAADLGRPLYGASFGEAVKRFFQGYVRFRGRASQSEFWWAQLFTALLCLIPLSVVVIAYAGIFVEIVKMAPDPPVHLFVLLLIGGTLCFLVSLAILLPSLSLLWRRLQDANLPGPLCFLMLVPYAGPFVPLVFGFIPSAPAGRRFDAS